MSISACDLEKTLMNQKSNIIKMEDLESNLLSNNKPIQMLDLESKIIKSVKQESKKKKINYSIYSANVGYPGMLRTKLK
jgi:hypothetical protein